MSEKERQSVEQSNKLERYRLECDFAGGSFDYFVLLFTVKWYREVPPDGYKIFLEYVSPFDIIITHRSYKSSGMEAHDNQNPTASARRNTTRSLFDV